MKVYFVRHGESEMNAKQMHQPSDSKLSENGIKQAEFVAKRLSHLPIEEIISSPFDRAKQTSEIISHHLNKNTTYSSLFVERKRPSEIENRYDKDPFVIEIKDQIKKNYHNVNWHHSDEENFNDVKRRASSAIK